MTSDTPGTGSESSFTEDASDNLTTLPTGASGTYDHASELTSSVLSGTTTNYTYDASGNRTGESTGATLSATYNGAGELTSYDNASADMSSATYNGLGLRTSVTSTPSGGSASTQDFVWDTNTSVPVLLEDSTYAYIYGPSGTPFEQVKMSSGTVKYLVSDALGSVRGVVSSSGSLSASTSYSAWGAPETTGGLTSSTPFGFAGSYTDSTKLLYLENRYYDPSTGNFFSIDPDVNETGEAYAYAGDDPVSNSDPTGLCNGLLNCLESGFDSIRHGAASAYDAANGVAVQLTCDAVEPGSPVSAALHCDNSKSQSYKLCVDGGTLVIGVNPDAPLPPNFNPETWTVASPSRPSNPFDSFYDPEGNEWRFHPAEDNWWHAEPHWDVKPWSESGNAPWRRVNIPPEDEGGGLDGGFE